MFKDKLFVKLGLFTGEELVFQVLHALGNDEFQICLLLSNVEVFAKVFESVCWLSGLCYFSRFSSFSKWPLEWIECKKVFPNR